MLLLRCVCNVGLRKESATKSPFVIAMMSPNAEDTRVGVAIPAALTVPYIIRPRGSVETGPARLTGEKTMARVARV